MAEGPLRFLEIAAGSLSPRIIWEFLFFLVQNDAREIRQGQCRRHFSSDLMKS